MRWQDWINPLLGLWLIVSPFLMVYLGGYGGVAAWNSYLVGAALVIIPLLGLSRPLPWREWLVLALGVWLVIAPFLLGFTNEYFAFWNLLLTGIVVVIVSAARLKAIGKGARGA